jgi:PAS domain S-box-containing protein
MALGLFWSTPGLTVIGLSAVISQLIPFTLIHRRMLRASVFAQIILSSAAVTAMAVLGQGIRDVVVTAYPIIIFLASLTLNTPILVFAGFLVVAMVTLLLIGQTSGVFVPQAFTQPIGVQEYVGVVVILTAAAVAANLITSATRKATRNLRQEITEKEKTTNALKESRVLSEKMFEMLPMPIAGFPAKGGPVIFNKAFERVFGYTTGDVRNLDEWFRLAFPDIAYRQQVSENFARILTAPAANFGPIEREVVSKDGKRLHGVVSGTRVGEAVVVAFYDLTEQKQAEKIIQSSTAMYQDILEQSPLAINITRGTSIIFANPRYLQMFGYGSIAEIEALAPLEIFSPESRAGVMENIRRRACGLPAPSDYAAECMRKDGTKFPIHMYLSRVNLEEGPATIAFITDITEQKEVEAQEQALREKAEISSRLASIGEIASGIAHEINNPLASVVGFSELLLERQDLPEDVARAVGIIHNGSERVQPRGHRGAYRQYPGTAAVRSENVQYRCGPAVRPQPALDDGRRIPASAGIPEPDHQC